MSNLADFDLARLPCIAHLEFVIGNWGFAAQRRNGKRAAARRQFPITNRECQMSKLADFDVATNSPYRLFGICDWQLGIRREAAQW